MSKSPWVVPGDGERDPLWKAVPRAVDEPVKLLGLELEDFAFVAVAPVLLCRVMIHWQAVILTLALGVAIYYLKRGKPSGTLLHMLHDWQLLKLPGVLAPGIKWYSPWRPAYVVA